MSNLQMSTCHEPFYMPVAWLSWLFCSFSLKTCNSNHKIISSNRNECFELKFDSWLYKFRGVFCAFYGIMKWMRKNTQPGIWTPLWQTVLDSNVNMCVSVSFNYVCLFACLLFLQEKKKIINDLCVITDANLWQTLINSASHVNKIGLIHLLDI